MKIFFPKELDNELRTSIVPSVVQKFISLELEVFIEKGIGKTISLSDDVYLEAGAKIIKNRIILLSYIVSKSPDYDFNDLKRKLDLSQVKLHLICLCPVGAQSKPSKPFFNRVENGRFTV